METVEPSLNSQSSVAVASAREIEMVTSTAEVESEPHRPLKRRGESPKFDDEEKNSGPVSVEDRRIVLSTEQFVDALLHDMSRTDEFFCQDTNCSAVFKSAKEYNAHYISQHRYKCDTCKKPMPGYHLLELHVLENHDTLFSLMAQRKPMYSCLAEECPRKFQTAEERYDHFHIDHKNHNLFGTFRHFQLLHSPQPHFNDNKSSSNKPKQNNRPPNKSNNIAKSKPTSNALPDGSGDSSQMEIDLKLNPKGTKERSGQKSSEEEIRMEESSVVEERGINCAGTAAGTSEDLTILPKLSLNHLSSKKSDDKQNSNSNNKAVHKNAPITFGHHGHKFKFRPWHSQGVGSGSGSTNSNINVATVPTDSMDLSSIQNVLGHNEPPSSGNSQKA